MNKSGGFFGQNSSSQDYTGEKGNDDRAIVTTLEEVLNSIEDSGKISGMRLRQLRQTRSKVTQIRGLLSSRQLTPASYSTLADIADALRDLDCNRVMQIIASTEQDRALKLASRNWLPSMKQLVNLVRIATN